MRKGKRSISVHVRLHPVTYGHLCKSMSKGSFRSVASLISSLCDYVALRREIAGKHHPMDAHREIEGMFKTYAQWEEGKHV